MGVAVLLLALWQRRWRGRWSAATRAAVLLAAAIALQIVPLPRWMLAAVSPASVQMASSLDIGFANGISHTHAFSVNPGGTWMALSALLVGIAWTLTCASMLRQPGAARRLARNVSAVATLVAILGLAHKATYNGKVLWFWTPEFHAWNSFGPFVNRNHFAGWMLLALSVSVGLLAGYLHRSRPAQTGFRERLLWIGSPAGAPVLVTAAAVLAMACSLLWTMSRSGIASAGVATGVMAAAAMWRSPGSRHRWAVAASAIAAATAVVMWRGAETLFAWYGRTTTLEWRIQLWKDTWPALQDFWITGSGLNTYATLLLTYPRTDLRYLPRAAHNDYLQLALEGGVLVGVPVLILLVVLARETLRGFRAPQDESTWWIRMGAVAGVCGMAVQEISEFSLQVPGVALLFATCVAFAIHEPAPPHSRRSGTRGLTTQREGGPAPEARDGRGNGASTDEGTATRAAAVQRQARRVEQSGRAGQNRVDTMAPGV